MKERYQLHDLFFFCARLFFLLFFFSLFLAKCKSNPMLFREERGLARATLNCPGPVHLGSWHREQKECRRAQPVCSLQFWTLSPHTYFIFALLSKTSNRQERLQAFSRKNHTLFCAGSWGSAPHNRVLTAIKYSKRSRVCKIC